MCGARVIIDAIDGFTSIPPLRNDWRFDVEKTNHVEDLVQGP